MAYLLLQILFGVVTIVLALYYYFTSTFDFWKVRNVPGPKPIPLFGNIKDVLLTKLAMCDFLTALHKQYGDEPFVGLFTTRTPILVVHDPKFIKDVLIRDFSKFSDRSIHISEKAEPLSPNLFYLKVDRWRPLRARLAPVFTSGKLKKMFPLILECSDRLEQYLDKVIKEGDCVDVRELMAKYTTDVIGICAFGIEANNLADADSDFRRLGRTVFSSSLGNIIRFRLRQSMPWFAELLSNVLPQEEVTTFFTNLISETLAYRDENNIVRPDFVNMLLQLKRQPDKLENIKITDTFLAAQAYVFFIAGFETSALTMSNALYELALNPDIQDKLRKEIREHDDKNKGELKYEQLKEMRYLNLVFRETMRKYPAAPLISRKSTADYCFEGTKLTIPKGTDIWIPLFTIHRNPKVYPNPDAFIPERFTEDAVQARNPMNDIPFGEGPRICIGIKFADCQTKLGLIKILRNHRVDVCEKTMIPYVFDSSGLLVAPKGGIYLKITKLEG
ncbi:cytochrome P450 6a2-like isoform X2 [Lasioglossum baleicum]|uniref:cytochrome P450 6a2-like isoform X2 n=2 Tax=Lasioglossum baleicum TaxID=434251 RepID=UPI003FCEAE38